VKRSILTLVYVAALFCLVMTGHPWFAFGFLLLLPAGPLHRS
jgi:hypothetical protein